MKKKHHDGHTAMKAKTARGPGEHYSMHGMSKGHAPNSFAPQEPHHMTYAKTGRSSEMDYPDNANAIHRDQEQSIKVIHAARNQPDFRH